MGTNDESPEHRWRLIKLLLFKLLLTEERVKWENERAVKESLRNNCWHEWSRFFLCRFKRSASGNETHVIRICVSSGKSSRSLSALTYARDSSAAVPPLLNWPFQQQQWQDRSLWFSSLPALQPPHSSSPHSLNQCLQFIWVQKQKRPKWQQAAPTMEHFINLQWMERSFIAAPLQPTRFQLMAFYKRFYASMLYIACRHQVLNTTIKTSARNELLCDGHE